MAQNTTRRAEQDRMIEYLDLYYQSSEETTIEGAALVTAQQNAQNPPPVAGASAGGSFAARANKTITSRRTTLGKSTLSPQGKRTLQSSGGKR